MYKKILITKEASDFKCNFAEYFPLLKSIICLNDQIIEQIIAIDTILISSFKGAQALLTHLIFYPELKNIIANKKFITIGDRAFQLLRDNNFDVIHPVFSDTTTLIRVIQLNKKILYISGCNTNFKFADLQKLNRIILYQVYLNPFTIAFLNKLYKFKYIFVYSRDVASYLNTLPQVANATFVCISARVAETLDPRKNILISHYPLETSMLELINL